MAVMTIRPSTSRRAHPVSRRFSWSLLALALVLAAAGFGWWNNRPVHTAFYGGELTPAAPLPALTLARADGDAFTTADLEGRVSLFFFGYTTCPDVCPMALARAAQVRGLLGDRAQKLDIYFVTVDPARDTVERLAGYTRGFDPTIAGLTGTPEQLQQANAAFGVFAERRATPDSAVGYFMDHSATFYIVDQQARVRLIYPPEAIAQEIASDVAVLLQEGRGR